MIIPKNMNNEHSKLVATLVVKQREADIANCKLQAAKLRLINYEISIQR